MRRLAYPTTKLQASNLVRRLQETFNGGLNVDSPATELGEKELAGLVNIIADEEWLEGRRGVRKMSDTTLPIINFNDDLGNLFTCYKEGNKVYVVGGDRTIDDLTVGAYIKWPDGLNDQITEKFPAAGPGEDPYFISPTTGNKAEATCTTRGHVWGAGWNKKNKYVVIHIHDRLYWTDYTFAQYNEIYCLSTDRRIGQSRSTIKREDDTMLVFNANGVYRIAWDDSGGYYFPLNTAIPESKIDDVPTNSARTIGRRVTYSLSRIVGDHRGDRLTTGNVTQHQTAPVKKYVGLQADTADVYSDMKFGLGDETYGYLQTDLMTYPTGVSLNLANYDYSDAAIKIGMNSMGAQTVLADLSSPASMQDIALRFQTAIQGIFPDATFVFAIQNGLPIFILTTGLSDGSTIDSVASPDFGTDFMAKFGLVALEIDNAKPYTAPVAYTGFEAPEGSEHETHFTFWGSKDIGRAGLLAGFNPNYLVWLMDVPRVRAFSVDKTIVSPPTNSMLESLTDSLFKAFDVGNYIRYANGAEDKIKSLSLYDGAETVAQESGYALVTTSTAAGEGASAIGAAKVSYCTQSATALTLDGAAEFIFEAGDVGKTVFFEDGTATVITRVIDDTHAVVRDSATRTTIACAWMMEKDHYETAVSVSPGATTGSVTGGEDFIYPGMYLFTEDGEEFAKVLNIDTPNPGDFILDRAITAGYTGNLYWGGTLPRQVLDTVTDETIDNRRDVAFYILQMRFFLPLPSSKIGEVYPGFISIFEENSNKHKYSEVPAGDRARAGYYWPGSQEDDGIDDVVMLLKRYPDRLVAFGKKSTWAVLTNAPSVIQEIRTGFSATILPRFQLLDNRGIVHVKSLQDIDIGVSLVITHEPAVCVFDGTAFSPANVADNRVMNYIGTIDNDLATSYDSIGGYLIYGTQQMQEDDFNRITPESGLCLRLAVKPEQGSLWSILSGASWVWPEPEIGGIQIEDGRDYGRQVALDERTGKWYEISTYEGPAESGLTECWTDKDDAEIDCSILLPEHKGAAESYLMEFLEAHAYLRSMPDLDYRTGFQMDAWIYKNGEQTHIATTKNIGREADIYFDRPAKAKRLQLGLTFNRSCFRVVALDEYYNAMDMANSTPIDQRQTESTVNQEDYTDSLLWITRGLRPTLNRAIGNLSTVVGDSPAQVEGPDGMDDSALEFDGSGYLETPARDTADTDFSIQFGFKLAADTIPIGDEEEPPDGSFWDGMDKLGGTTTFIARNMTDGRFEFVIENEVRAYLDPAGWSLTEPVGGLPATSMEIGFDQDRSLWLFFIDGLIVGCVDGNNQSDNFKTEIPETGTALGLLGYVHCDDENERMVFYTRTINDTEVRATGYIDETGYHNGAPA